MYRIKKQTIKALEKHITEGINEFGEKYQAVQILPELKKDYPDQLRPEVVSLRLYQTETACYLETTIDEFKEKGIDPNENEVELGYPYESYSRVDYRIHRISLSFIIGEEGPGFSPKCSVLDNAAEFLVGMDAYDLINCTDLFTKESADAINENYLKSFKTDPNDPEPYLPG